MLTPEDNELLTRTDRGTPMGEAIRRFWLPILLQRRASRVDCAPVRVRVVGENLVAFQATDGSIGLLEEICPHRRASLFWGRNEEQGLRCVYHGWKFDTSRAVCGHAQRAGRIRVQAAGANHAPTRPRISAA